LRGWSDEDHHEVFPGGSGAGGSDGARARGEHGSQWAAISSIAAKIGCTAETLRRWVRQAETDACERAGLPSDERERMKALEREVKELRQANEILRKASAYFAQAELDRRSK
jgi:transposase